jgi:hypothetical protein
MNLNVGAVKSDSVSSFPFTRLATLVDKQQNYFVYHQMDGQTIAEDSGSIYQDWQTSKITVT